LRARSILAAAVLLTGAAPSPAAPRPVRSRRAVKAAFPEGSSAILDHADKLTLYELDPTQRGKSTAGKTFWEYPVVSEKDVTDPKEREELVQTLYGCMAEQKVGARCFVPHHGLRAVRGDKSVDLVLCFTCQWIHIHYGGKTKVALLAARGMPVYDKALRPARPKPEVTEPDPTPIR
jgi:hypothetical protein